MDEVAMKANGIATTTWEGINRQVDRLIALSSHGRPPTRYARPVLFLKQLLFLGQFAVTWWLLVSD